MDDFGALLEGQSLALDGVGAGFRLDLGGISLSGCCELALLGACLGLGDAHDFFILGLEGHLLGFHLGLDGTVELWRKIKVRDSQIRDSDGVFQPLFVEGAVEKIAERILDLLLAELPVKTAVKLAADISGAPRNALYALALEKKPSADSD